MGLRAFLTSRRYLILLASTAGTWFLLDYAYYGNTISTPQILGLISPGASAMTKIALQLTIRVAAVPGYPQLGIQLPGSTLAHPHAGHAAVVLEHDRVLRALLRDDGIGDVHALLGV